MIWEYCLVVGEISPFPEVYQRNCDGHQIKRRPDVALLRTHTSITEETRQILYGQNLFVLSMRAGKWYSYPERSDFLPQRVKLIFDFSDHSSYCHADAWAQKRGHKLRYFQASTRLVGWWDKLWLLRGERLAHLTLDFENCDCELGCCRQVDHAANWFDFCFNMLALGIDGMPEPREVVLTGLKDEGERAIMERSLWSGERNLRWRLLQEKPLLEYEEEAAAAAPEAE
ncbi:MAG: hypothetical protein Q9187_007076 [Circinaria calcarea]